MKLNLLTAYIGARYGVTLLTAREVRRAQVERTARLWWARGGSMIEVSADHHAAAKACSKLLHHLVRIAKSSPVVLEGCGGRSTIARAHKFLFLAGLHPHLYQKGAA